MDKTNFNPVVAMSFILLLISKSTFASDWKYLTSQDIGDGNEIDWFVDLSSITKDGDLRRDKEKAMFEPFSRKGLNANSKKWERKWITTNTYDCQRMLVRSESMTVYYYDGTRWEDNETSYPSGWHMIADESTIWGRVLKIVCGSK